MERKNNFNFWCPIEISKAKNDAGEDIMLLGGIASTADEDSDGEFLDPKGFDIKPLIESGMVNWHHQAKTCPATIVGEPTKAEIKKEGLYIETMLYPSSQVARDIWDLAKTLDKDSSTRRLGYSIEGKVLERESNDKNSAGYKKITKAVITGVAITHQPKNPKTFANIIKGEIDDDLEEDDVEKEKNTKKEEKSLDTTSARPLIKEDLDHKVKVLTFGKSMVMDKIFQDIPGISIEKAKKVYSLIKNISNMAKRKQVTEEDILKAYDALGLDSSEIVKADDDTSEEDVVDTSDNEEEEDDDVKVKKAKTKKNAEEEDDEPMEEEETEEEEPEDTEKAVKKGNLFSRFERIEKAIATSHLNNASYIKALGVMVKSGNQNLEKAIKALNLANEKIDELSEINKAQQEEISSLSEQLAAFGSEVPAPKALRHSAPVERTFGKAQENELEKGGDNNSVSIRDKAAVTEILDQATFHKGYDQEFSKACLDYEATGNITPNVISRIKNEFGISILK